jgi:DNA invertase Pin-like site-specific DNA recombinase
LTFPIIETRQPFAYQQLAEKARNLKALGMSARTIARALEVTDKTITKALRFRAETRHHPLCKDGRTPDTPQKPGRNWPVTGRRSDLE